MAALRALAGDLNTDPWVKAYKWAKNKGPAPDTVLGTLKRADGSYTETIEETVMQLLGAFAPEETSSQDMYYHGPLIDTSESISRQKVKASIWRSKPNKAPGRNGISAKILKKAWPTLEASITRLYNSALKESYFPVAWRNANVIVIPKGGNKNPMTTSAFRPISLLPVLGKALETFIIKAIEKETRLSEIGDQHDFVQGRSTSTAIKTLYNWLNGSKSRHVIGIFLDISGAFDNVSWEPLMKQLERIGASLNTIRMEGSYLTVRQSYLTLEGKVFTKKLERGCPQGSQLGPTLWKIAISELLALPSEENIKVIAYADDIALLVEAPRHETAIRRAEIYLNKVIKWPNAYKLTFSLTKTHALSLKGGNPSGLTNRDTKSAWARIKRHPLSEQWIQ